VSSDFYQIIGLQKIDSRESGNDPWSLLTDGKIQFMLSQNPFNSPAITFFVGNLENKFKEFHQKGLILHRIEEEASKSLSGVMTDPNGFGIIFIQLELNKLPTLTQIRTPQTTRLKEILIQTKKIDSTLMFYKNIGLRSIEKSSPTTHWITYENGLFNIKLEENTESQPPILTFRTDNLSALTNKLENEGYKIIEKITNQSNLILKTVVKSPDELLIYLTSD
jgi:hypothetical protein